MVVLNKKSDVIHSFIDLLPPIRAVCSQESLCQLQCEHCCGDVGCSQRCQLLLCAGCGQSGLDSYLQYKSDQLFYERSSVWSDVQCDCNRAQPGLQQHCGV